MELPLDIQTQILTISELPIDTRIYFQRNGTIQPKRLTEAQKPAEFIRKLRNLCEHRVSCYEMKRRLEGEGMGFSFWLLHTRKEIEDNKYCEIFIDVDKRDNNEIKQSIRIIYTDDIKEEEYTLRKTIVKMHTGELTGDFYDDSEDEW